MIRRILFGDNLPYLRQVPDSSIDMIYIDPPFNTGRSRRAARMQTVRDSEGDRIGFQGKRYQTKVLDRKEFSDAFDDYLGFLAPRLCEARRVLAKHGSIYLHLDFREVHYVKVLMDELFGRECFLNDIVWAYDYGARATKRWPAKHDSILLYVKDPRKYHFDINEVDRIPYMAPGLVSPEKAARGKTPTDTWWHTIVATNGRERTGYPTQKPLGVVERAVKASCIPHGVVMDFFAGSGTSGEAALRSGRQFILIDNNAEAMEVMARRFAGVGGIGWENYAMDFRPGEVEPARGASAGLPAGLGGSER
jgi:site-specific DNA-methyltransferase (adenine-specific)